jgi:hypothetical protein
VRKIIAVMASMAVIVGVSASAAFAGEVKGPPGDPLNPVHNTNDTAAPSHARSDCAYSGLNDMDTSLGQTDSIVQTPKDAGYPGAPAFGWTITIPNGPTITVSCNPNGPVENPHA